MLELARKHASREFSPLERTVGRRRGAEHPAAAECFPLQAAVRIHPGRRPVRCLVSFTDMSRRPGKMTAVCGAGVVAFTAGALAGRGDSWPTEASAAPINLGRTVLLARRTRVTSCKLAANPDRRCSPGAYYSGLTKEVICTATFRTGPIRNVPESEKFQVEREYGMPPGHYGRSLEIDHIVSLELGGSNDIANLFPEGAYAHPGYRIKDVLENELHRRVCAGTMGLRAVQRGIAANWQALYRNVFRHRPSQLNPPELVYQRLGELPPARPSDPPGTPLLRTPPTPPSPPLTQTQSSPHTEAPLLERSAHSWMTA
jgi:hypothetical protein